MERIYRRLGLPSSQIHALDQTVQVRLPHHEGVHNAAYRPVGLEMLRLQP